MKNPRDFTSAEAKFAAECMNFAAVDNGCDGPAMEAQHVVETKPRYVEEALRYARGSGELNLDGQTFADALLAS